MNLKEKLDKILSNPVYVLLFFILVNILPNIGLVFTEPFNWIGCIVLLLFPVGVYMVVFSLFKNFSLVQLFLIPLLIIHAFQIVVFYLFGEDVVAADMFLNLVTTNATEAGEVLYSILPSVIFVIIVYIPTIVLASVNSKKKIYLSDNLKNKILILGIIVVSLSFGLSYFAENRDTKTYKFYQDVYPVNMGYNLYFAVQKWHKSRNYFETSKDFSFNASKEKKSEQREIYVLIIGETGRAENWGLYGYDRNTTPLLAKDSNIVVFDDAITQSNTTHKSVPILMSAASAENYDIIYSQKSIIEAFKEVGFTTVFISNQSANHTFTDFFAQESDYIHYYRHFNDRTNNLDEVLLPQFKHYIDSIQGNLFIVLHTYGSHFNYKERYPDKFSIYKPDNVGEINRRARETLINAYDNSILYTDYFLHNVIDILTQSGACASFFYSSDHGEDIMDDKRNRFLHASPNPTFYQLKIPMLLWFSPIYVQSYKQNVANASNNRLKPVATNSAFHTILDIAHIQTEYLDKSLSLVNPNFERKKRMYLNDHDKPILYYNAGLKDEDKALIRERNMFVD